MTKRYISLFALAFGLLLGTTAVMAEGPELPAAGTNIRDTASLQRGAHIFFNYCVGCHSLKYIRYERISDDLGLTQDDVMKNLNFTGGKFGDPVITHMPADDAEKFFGKVPPDLSLEVSAKGPDWVFAYLNSFYIDPKDPHGWNNLILPNAAMPFPLWELQGVQVPAPQAPPKSGESPAVEKLILQHPGKLTPEQYQQAARDVTNFLEYVSEPAALQRRHYGIWVVLFLLGFTFLAYLLKKEYWKDVH